MYKKVAKTCFVVNCCLIIPISTFLISTFGDEERFGGQGLPLFYPLSVLWMQQKEEAPSGCFLLTSVFAPLAYLPK